MINKSFQLLRTDPLLTSNLKLVVTSDYNLYLESFNSNNELSNVKYKHFKIQKTDYLENKIPYFYKGLPIDLAFDIRYDGDNKVVQNDYSKQFDTTYYAGGGYVEDQWYTEEFDYLAPLYIRKDNLPKGFVIMRVDDPSGYNLNSTNFFELDSLNASNFGEIINNWKCVKYFDMTYSSDLGMWLYNNYSNNDRYPKTAFEYHPERAEFSNWYGMDYNTGIYTYKPLFMDDRDEIETPHFRWEKFITEGYKKGGLIYPYILNLKFLFDDTPATPNSLRKYSMNRYYGFYVENLDYVGNITSYRTPDMIEGTYLVNNIIVSGDTGTTTLDQICRLEFAGIPSVNPFKELWDDNKEYYVFIDNTLDFYRTKTISGLYPVQRVIQNSSYVYKVISDETLDSYWNIGYTNIKTVDINYNTYNILSAVTSNFSIDPYIDCDGNQKYMYGDLYLIKINDLYHVIKYSSGATEINELVLNPTTGDINDYKYYIQTDYAINLNEKELEYWILGKNSEYYRKYSTKNVGEIPMSFPIYRIKFSDVKDFDFDRVNTGFADFDFEKSEYVVTDEEKLYAFDYNDPSIPPSKRVGKLGKSDQYQISTISSEYIADDELYEVTDLGQQNTFSNTYGDENKIYELTDIWRKNQSIVKWGFMGSISHSDYPYKLNNNYEVGGPYNRTSDPFSTLPDVTSKNMDYFYRLGNFYYGDTGNTVYYKKQTTNIQYDFLYDQIGRGFNIEAYFTYNFDYFSFFFKNKMYYEDQSTLYNKSYDKYSVFNYGDQNTPSVTLFKGLKIKVKEIKNIYTENNKITKILNGDKTYNNYKISIIFNENYGEIDNGIFNNDGYIDTTENSVNIIMNEKFQNILVIINARLSGNTFLNDTSIYNETHGLYYGKSLNGDKIPLYNPNLFTAYNFINSINDYIGGYGLNIRYYVIREKDGVIYYGNSLMSRGDGQPSPFTATPPMTNIPDWIYLFPPFMLNIETPVNILLNNNCYTTYPYYVNSVDDDYVATLLAFDESKSEKVPIYRFPGPYEPIFKDINLFKGGFFCYNDMTTGSTSGETTTFSNSSLAVQYPLPAESLDWAGLESICTDKEQYVEVNCHTSKTGTESKYLCVAGFDFSEIPIDAIISGITLTLTRRSFVTNEPYYYAKDLVVKLAKNCYSPDVSSQNRALTGDSDFYIWSPNIIQITYGGEEDTWGDVSQAEGGWWGSTLTGNDIRSSYFGAVIKVMCYNLSDENILLAQVKCVNISVKYKYNKIVYTANRTVYFDNNYKFDTSLNDFAKIDELIYSKVNETTDVLNNNSTDLYKIYPCIDRFGYSYSDRFIFKSSWDKEFFTRTENKLNNI